MKLFTLPFAFLCAFLPGDKADLALLEPASTPATLSYGPGNPWVKVITDDVELCQVIDPDDNIFGLDANGHPLGLGTGWTDVASGYPTPAGERDLEFRIPGFNPDGLYAPGVHAGDPQTIVIKMTVRDRRWVAWEWLHETDPWQGYVPMTTQSSWQLRHQYSPTNPSYQPASINQVLQYPWHEWQPSSFTAFDGIADGDGTSGWSFACGSLYLHQQSSEWCWPGNPNWDYYTIQQTVIFDWATMDNAKRNAWRAGHKARLDFMLRQYANYNPGGSAPLNGADVPMTQGHNWAMAWGDRATVTLEVTPVY